MSAAVIPRTGGAVNQWAASAAPNRGKWRGSRRCGGHKGEGEKSPAGKLLPPVPSERKTGTNREGPLQSRRCPSSEGSYRAAQFLSSLSQRTSTTLKERSWDCEIAVGG